MAVNLLSMDVIVLACAVFRGVAPLPRARAEGVLCVVCASREPSGATRRVRCARRAAGAARAALGSSRVQRRSGRVRGARCAGSRIAQALNCAQQRCCFCATVWRRAAKLFAQFAERRLLFAQRLLHLLHRLLDGSVLFRKLLLCRPFAPHAATKELRIEAYHEQHERRHADENLQPPEHPAHTAAHKHAALPRRTAPRHQGKGQS